MPICTWRSDDSHLPDPGALQSITHVRYKTISDLSLFFQGSLCTLASEIYNTGVLLKKKKKKDLLGSTSASQYLKVCLSSRSKL